MAHRRFLMLLVALALTVGACSGQSIVESTATTDPTPTTARPATTTPGNGGTDGARDEIQARIDELIIEAQQIRNLEFLYPVEVILLDDEQYQARFRELLDEEIVTEDVEAINAVLRMLGIIQPDDDYLQLIETLLTSGTGGFYDPETEELVVRLFGDDFGPYAESVVVHELVHALQDQHFDLLDNEDLEGDIAYVASAIVEGDALLREVSYVQALSLAEQADYLAATAEIDLSALETLPDYIVEGFQSAYLDGFFFHQEIGLDQIDSQFTNLPESSEQLLDSDKYFEDEQPRPVALPDLELPGYTLWFDATAGQKDLELLLADGIGPVEAERAAAGWGGDHNRIYNAGDAEAVYVLQYVGDTKAEAEELEAAFDEFIETMVADDAYTLVERDADRVLVIIASDAGLGPQLEAAFSS